MDKKALWGQVLCVRKCAFHVARIDFAFGFEDSAEGRREKNAKTVKAEAKKGGRKRGLLRQENPVGQKHVPKSVLA